MGVAELEALTLEVTSALRLGATAADLTTISQKLRASLCSSCSDGLLQLPPTLLPQVLSVVSDVVKQSLLPDEHMHGELVTAVCELMKTTLGLLPVPRGGDGDGGGGGVARAADHAIGSAIGAAARALVAVCAAEEARGRRSGVTNFCVMNAAWRLRTRLGAAPPLLRLVAAGAAGATAEELQASVLAHARQALERVAEAPPPALDEALKVASFILNHLRGFCVSYGPWAAAEAATGSQAARELGTGLGRLLALLPPACVHGDAVQEAMPKLEKLRASVEISMQELLTGAAVGGQRVGGVPHISASPVALLRAWAAIELPVSLSEQAPGAPDKEADRSASTALALLNLSALKLSLCSPGARESAAVASGILRTAVTDSLRAFLHALPAAYVRLVTPSTRGRPPLLVAVSSIAAAALRHAPATARPPAFLTLVTAGCDSHLVMRTVAGELWRSLAATLPADDRATQAATLYDAARRLPPSAAWERRCLLDLVVSALRPANAASESASAASATAVADAVFALIDVPLRSAETVLASPDTDGRQAAVRTALQLLDRVCSLSKAEAMTAISAPLVRAGGVHWLRAIVRALEAAAADGCGGGDDRCVWGGEGGEKSDDGGCGGGTSSSVGSRTGLKACDGDAEPFEAALWHGAAALATLLPPSAALPLPLASALLLRLETRLRPGAGANLATVAAAAATTAPAVCACALGPQQLLQVLRLLDGLLDGAVINSRPAAGGTHPGSAARIAAPLAALAREVVARANAALGGVDRQQALSTALLSSVKRLHALAEAAGGGRGGHAVDCVEAHEAGWAVMNLMEDGPPTVGVALFGASPAEGAAGTMLMEYATRVGEKRRADASVATLQCEEEAARHAAAARRRRREAAAAATAAMTGEIGVGAVDGVEPPAKRLRLASDVAHALGLLADGARVLRAAGVLSPEARARISEQLAELKHLVA